MWLLQSKRQTTRRQRRRYSQKSKRQRRRARRKPKRLLETELRLGCRRYVGGLLESLHLHGVLARRPVH